MDLGFLLVYGVVRTITLDVCDELFYFGFTHQIPGQVQRFCSISHYRVLCCWRSQRYNSDSASSNLKVKLHYFSLHYGSCKFVVDLNSSGDGSSVGYH